MLEARLRPLLDRQMREGMEPFLRTMRRRLERDRNRVHAYHDDLRSSALRRLAALTHAEGDRAQADRRRETLRVEAIEREYRAKLDDLRHNYALRITIEWVQALDLHLPVQRFEVLEDYQADSWSRPRRVVCKVECTPQGSQRRFVVSNLSGQPAGIYRGFYVGRGEVPEQPIDELKNGLDLGRRSAHGFRANAYRLLLHVVAYGLVVLLREAAAAVPEVARATVSSLRSRLWKVGAWVEQKAGRLWFHVAASWPWRELWQRVQAAVEEFTATRAGREGAGGAAPEEVGG